MFLYPSLAAGFLFVGVPLLVHLINMLRHRRQTWAAMDFLMASYRKQKNWILLKQLLLLLSRLAIAATLVAMLAGWVLGGKWIELAGSRTIHHVVILDDSYSMGDTSGGATAYSRALATLRALTERLATDDGSHQLTVMRSSRAAMVQQSGAESADAAADLSARTILGDAAIINRVIASEPSPLRIDLVPALELATKLVRGTTVDETIVYLASDFRNVDWQSPQRAAESIAELSRAGAKIRMFDCATSPSSNLGITRLVPQPDVWVAGVPVVIQATIKNYGLAAVKNVSVACRVVKYGDQVLIADPTKRLSGVVEPLPSILIEDIPAGGEITKTFQVYITEKGTHAVELSIPDDALPIDNQRSVTLPLSDIEKVLVIDGQADGRGAYFVGSVLNPGSQVRTGALPDIQPPSFLRGATIEQLRSYRAIYLISVPDLSENVAEALYQYVVEGGGLYWFLGNDIDRDSYNRYAAGSRRLLPAELREVVELAERSVESTGDIVLGQPSALTAPLVPIGDSAFALVAVRKSWTLAAFEDKTNGESADAVPESERPVVRDVIRRRDGKPLVTEHDLGRGRIVTNLVGLDPQWTNWAGDPTFVVLLLQANAYLWSAASPDVEYLVTDSFLRPLPADQFVPAVMYFPPVNEPPRVAIEMTAAEPAAGDVRVATIDVTNEFLSGASDVESLLQTGTGEWSLTRTDGVAVIEPVAVVIQNGEGDLKRTERLEIQRAVRPVDVRFVSAGELADQYGGGAGSTTTTILLALLALLLAGEQWLAYASSYHPPIISGGDGSISRGALGARATKR